jgi:hypothetical protein
MAGFLLKERKKERKHREERRKKGEERREIYKGYKYKILITPIYL